MKESTSIVTQIGLQMSYGVYTMIPPGLDEDKEFAI
jgi:hypothetical protein